MPVRGNISGHPNMLRNLFRQSFWAVFVPLLLAAGLFWMDELRGYRAELSLLVLPKTALAEGAAANLVALARQTSFALAVYDAALMTESPLVGKTPAERQAIWKKAADIRLVSESDVIRISSFGADQDEALVLAKSIVVELVRTGSQYYNQKTDVDIRIVEEPATIPSLTAWPRFVAYTIGTALFFATLFFLVYGLIERFFPKRSMPSSQPLNGEYVISPDTFKPRMPAYWPREEESRPVETEKTVPEEMPDIDEVYPAETTVTEYVPSAVTEPSSQAEMPVPESAAPADAFEETEEYVEEANVPDRIEDEVFADESYQEEPASLPSQPAYAGYVSHAAAPDNLPIVEPSITPLQGAQARLMKADIDATAEAYASEAEAALSAEPAKPQTHEPTPDEYRRRLNELLSGKM